MFHDVVTDLKSHLRTDACRETIVEAGPDARVCDLFGRGRHVVKRWTTPGSAGFVSAISGTSSVPSTALTTPATAPLWMQCEQGYSGCIGVGPIGCQIALRSVAGLPSMSPFRIGSFERRRRSPNRSLRRGTPPSDRPSFVPDNWVGIAILRRVLW